MICGSCIAEGIPSVNELLVGATFNDQNNSKVTNACSSPSIWLEKLIHQKVLFD